MTDTLIFDFDGTLADSLDLVVHIAYDLTGIPKLSPEQEQNLRKLPLMKIPKALGIPMHRLPKLVIKGRAEMQRRIGEVKPFQEIPKVLKELHAAGHQLLVTSSNSEQNVRTFLRAYDLEHYFGGVYGGVGVFDKAGALRKVMKRNQLKVEECWYIGDEVRDIQAAHKIHMRIASVTWGYQASVALEAHQPTLLAAEPRDLIQYFNVK